MATHRFSPRQFHNTLGSHPPVFTLADGDTLITETLDAHGFDREGRLVASDPNPMTGPFFIEGAEPGDTLAVTIARISMVRATGWTRAGLAANVVDPGAVSRLPRRDKTTWLIDIAASRIAPEIPPPKLRNWSIPVEPMIGCFGVAPDMG